MKKKILLFEHGGSGNHGCEAIVRTTCDMLGDNDYYLQTLIPQEDEKFGLDKFIKLIKLSPKNTSRNSVAGLKMRVKSRLSSHLTYDDFESAYRNKDVLFGQAVALSVGGDNYSYRGIIGSMHDKLMAFKVKKIPAVLWGCSVDKDHLTQNVIDDLKQYSLITARETLTVEVLKEVGITDTVVLCADPAFTLKKQASNWNTEIMQSGNVIGLNVSDFMRNYNAYPNATYNNYKNLIKHILDNTDSYIAMIPHVCQAGNNDIAPIKQLASEFNSERILVVDNDFNCMQLKDIISKCKMFIGCRTHSTIAAYSTCVPTLVVGYSIKAKGICKDLFGEYDDLLVDVHDFKSDDDLTEKFKSFAKREDELRAHLEKIMPEYINRAYSAKDALAKII